MLDVPLRLKKKGELMFSERFDSEKCIDFSIKLIDNKKTKALLWEESCTHLLAGELDEEEDEEAEMEISGETEDSESSTEDDLMDSDDDPICKCEFSLQNHWVHSKKNLKNELFSTARRRICYE